MAEDGPVSLAPPPALDADIFPLNENHMYLIQKYVKSGTILPTTTSDYQIYLKLDTKTVEKFKVNIADIVVVFSSIREHTTHYQATIHPDTVSLALSVTHYAAVVEVVYPQIFDAIMALDAANKLPDSPEKEIAVQRSIVILNNLIDTQVIYMSDLSARAVVIVDQLQTFESNTMDDRTNLLREQGALNAQMNDDNGEIKKLEDEIARLRRLIAEEQKAYEDKMDQINDIKKWAWIGLIGLATGAALKSKWTKEANAIAERLAANKDDMSEAEAELASCQAMMAQGSLMESDLAELIEMIGPAINTVQLLRGAFGAISDDLKNVKDKVNNGLREASAIIADIVIEAVIEQWKGLGAKAASYLDIAYIEVYDYSDPSQKI